MRRRSLLGTAVKVSAVKSMSSNAQANKAKTQALNQQMAQQQPAAAPATAQHAGVPTEELKKLAELRDQGILTEEEFQAKKKQILGL